MHRQADGAPVVGDRSADGLADPPGRVGREAEAAAELEAIHGLHQSNVAFLDQIQKRQAAIQILLGDRDDETQVGLDQHLLGRAQGFLGATQTRVRGDEFVGRHADVFLDFTLRRSQALPIPRGPRRLQLRVQLAEPLQQFVHDRRPDRLIAQDAADERFRLPVPLGRPIARHLVETRSKIVESFDPGERIQDGRDAFGLQLSPLGQQDQLRRRRLPVADARCQANEAAHRTGHVRQRDERVRARVLHLLADLHFLLRGQELGLSDLNEIGANRVDILRRQAFVRRFAEQDSVRKLFLLGVAYRLS